LRIEARPLEAILAHARAGHPLEICGVLWGRTDEAGMVVVEAVAVENRERIAPRVRYAIAPEDLLRLQREARAVGLDIAGYYHSHPDHPARPSETDRRMAAEGLSDGVVHVVVHVDGSGHAVPSAWVFRDASQAFEEESLEVALPGDGEGTDGRRRE
jgi:proteasome lid subunit RPN8/RPN11